MSTDWFKWLLKMVLRNSILTAYDVVVCDGRVVIVLLIKRQVFHAISRWLFLTHWLLSVTGREVRGLRRGLGHGQRWSPSFLAPPWWRFRALSAVYAAISNLNWNRNWLIEAFITCLLLRENSWIVNKKISMYISVLNIFCIAFINLFFCTT